jgi:DNA-binding response OmpR family regulator
LSQEAAGRSGAPSVRPGAPSVLLAEHDRAVADMLASYLTRDGLAVRSAQTPEQALAHLAVATESVAVLDLTMPGLDPRWVRRALRAPAVFLVAPGPRPRGLNARRRDANGAGGLAPLWLTRPFGPRMLVTAVRELLSNGVVGATYPSGGHGWRNDPLAAPAAGQPHAPQVPSGLALDASRRVVVAEGREVTLTATEFAILAALLAAPGRARSRRQLLAAAGRKAEDRAADVYITQLRAKIGVPGLIRTIRGAGYAAFPGGQ